MRIRLVCCLFFVCLVASGGVDPTGSIGGTVSDPSGAAVAGAKIVANDLNTGLSRTTTTGSDGGYILPLLPVGFYTISVESQGFERYEQQGIEVKTDQSSGVSVTLNSEAPPNP